MRELDYIIVGQGFAGSFMALELLQNNKSFIMFDNQELTASAIAAGVYNPVVLKRFNVIWQADKQIPHFIEKVRAWEDILQENFLNPKPVYRIFHDEHEKTTWLEKAKKEKLKPYLNDKIESAFPNVNSPYDAAQVNHSGRIDSRNFLHSIRNYLLDSNRLLEDKFNHEELQIGKTVDYKEYRAKNIVFAEGKGAIQNPYTSHFPIQLNKGECLQLKLTKSIEDFIYKKKHFLFRWDTDSYYSGGTYNRQDADELPTSRAQQELLESAQEMVLGPVEILNHHAAFRPVSPDRRPIVGQVQNNKPIYILNGMGSRGTLLGAYFATQLFHFIEKGQAIDAEANCDRFKKV